MSQDSGVWLLVQPAATSAIAYTVPRQACLGLTRAVLAGGDDPALWWSYAGGDPAVAAWLEGQRRLATLAPVASTAFAAPSGLRRIGCLPGNSLVSRLAATLAVGGPPPGCTVAGGMASAEAALQSAIHSAQEPSSEALLLLSAIERMRAHEQLVARFDEALAEARLEAMRELAYGAGHEINNPLANIATRAQALLLEEKDSERRRRLATIVDQAFRARDMIGGLMLFARPPKAQPVDTDVGGLVAAVIDSIQAAAAGRGVRLEYSPPPAPISAHVDRSQTEEAVRAIAVNAIEAVEEGGRVSLSAGLMAAAAGAVVGREWCEIAVADNGRGMDAATLRRAFDPFFSGREAGRGAGLGLSKAWRFTEASGGHVVVESRPGGGTRVSVMLPASERTPTAR